MTSQNTTCRYLLPLFGLTLGMCFAADERPRERAATVKSESLPVHSQMDSGSRVIKFLKRGDKVTVEFDVSTGPEEWCSIIETGQTKPLGFVICKELDRPQTRRVPELPLRHEDAKEKTDEGGQNQRRPQAVPAHDHQKLLLHGFDPDFWQSRLNFSDSQREQVGKLAMKTGMVCVRDVAKLYRQYGVWDFMSLAFASENPEFQRKFEPSLGGCLPKFIRFWTDFPSLMTPEQLARFQRERQSIGQFSSDPATGLMLYALHYVDRP